MNVNEYTTQHQPGVAVLPAAWSWLCVLNVILGALVSVTRFHGDMVTKVSRGSSG